MDYLAYDHDYPTCVETFSTVHTGDCHGKGRLQRKTNAWFYSSKNLSSSKDTRLLICFEALKGKDGLIQQLQSKGAKIDILTYWLSRAKGSGADAEANAWIGKAGSRGLVGHLFYEIKR